MYFANSNIDTYEEYLKRLEAAKVLADAEGVELIAEEYNHDEWLDEVAAGFENEPEKGSRCARCFRFNLAQTAKYAKEHGFDAFTSSLTISPHKVSAMVFSAGNDVSEPCAFLEIDFKKKNGYLKSLQRTKELGLYRQSYCGCEFSKLK
jgi:predicted adenine nucleotide alpha hydrolase (AANH) superfamily ATPase